MNLCKCGHAMDEHFSSIIKTCAVVGCGCRAFEAANQQPPRQSEAAPFSPQWVADRCADALQFPDSARYMELALLTIQGKATACAVDVDPGDVFGGHLIMVLREVAPDPMHTPPVIPTKGHDPIHEAILTPEQKKGRYYAVRCAECGWIGSSSDLDGGHAIPEAGDYDDTTCPKCHSDEINEIEDIKPRPAAVILAERYAHIAAMEAEIDRQQANEPAHQPPEQEGQL